MGWASWNHYFCDYDEKTIREQADALVSSGMRDVGYKYVVIQECIARDRDRNGALIVDSVRFPSGMPALTAYIHKLGLKAGVYTDIGLHTCYPNPRYQGSYGHEQQDADTFAAWGMDFVEMDYCNRVEEHSGRWVYERMAEAIRKTGRPMIFTCARGATSSPGSGLRERRRCGARSSISRSRRTMWNGIAWSATSSRIPCTLF